MEDDGGAAPPLRPHRCRRARQVSTTENTSMESDGNCELGVCAACREGEDGVEIEANVVARMMAAWEIASGRKRRSNWVRRRTWLERREM